MSREMFIANRMLNVQILAVVFICVQYNVLEVKILNLYCSEWSSFLRVKWKEKTKQVGGEDLERRK